MRGIHPVSWGKSVLSFQPGFESLSSMATEVTEHSTPAVLRRNLGCDSDQRKALNFAFMGPAFHQIVLRNKVLLFLTNECQVLRVMALPYLPRRRVKNFFF